MEGLIKLLIIDDNQDARELISVLLRGYRGVEIVGMASSVDEAMQLTLDLNPDLILLDIQMPGKNGFIFMEELKRHSIQPGIIFVTAYEDYAIRAIRNSAFDYLLKPVRKDELIDAIERYSDFLKQNRASDYTRLMDLLNRARPERVRLNTRTGYFFVDPSEIIYIEAQRNYSLISLASGKSETSTLSLGNLEKLVGSNNFIRISRSYLININHIIRVDRRTGICHLGNDHNDYQIKIPAQNIRLLEDRF